MSRTTAQVSFLDEIIVDSFAGGGGASTGIELATGRPVTIAINHDPDAILMHKTNHPYTEHYQASVWDVDPREVCQGRPVGLLWASPDCKHFSKAKGGKPVDKNIRGLAWIVLRWAGTVAPRVIMLENVEEFQTWGPVRKGRPVKSKAGQTFRQWLSQLEALGYAVEWRELVAAAATFRVLHGARNLPEEMAAGVISAAVLDGIQEAMRNDGGMREITLERSRK